MALPQPRNDTQHYTYGDYLSWPEDVRYELIDGVAYLMAPAPSVAHQDLVGEIYRQIANALQDRPCRAYISPLDVRLPKAEEADEQVDTVVQPDVIVVCDSSKVDRRGLRGAPDLVVEVLSPSTSRHDHVRKRRVYERAGVREYWLVHPVDRLLTIYRLDGDGFAGPEIGELAGETPINVLDDVIIRWDALLERLPPPEI